jgi:mannose-6-phosphate isomerase-like protein (cupin superfamily)
MAGSGLPFQVVADRRYDRSGDPRRLPAALAAGQTVYLPQVHQVLPRLARLLVAFRTTLFGPAREEASFLFLVQGTGRAGMGLHHDGPVDAVWLQLEGRRIVTLGPPVRPGTPLELDDALAAAGRRAGWRTLTLEPGTLLYLPPRTPHAVVCRGPSLAVTLTWRRRRRVPTQAQARRGLVRWDVASGFADGIPPPSPRWLWTQTPVAPLPGAAAPGLFRILTPDGETAPLPGTLRPWVGPLGAMPRLPRGLAARADLAPLLDAGVLGARDLPQRIHPDDPAGLDGWRFA